MVSGGLGNLVRIQHNITERQASFKKEDKIMPLGLFSGMMNAISQQATNSWNRDNMQLQWQENAKQAEISHQRQLELMDKAYDMNSPVNQRKRLEEAGLSVGLMYGGGGGGGSSVSTPSASQAAGAGLLQGHAAQFQMNSNIAELALLKSQKKALDSQANKNNAEAGKSQVDARLGEAEIGAISERLTQDWRKIGISEDELQVARSNAETMRAGQQENMRHNKTVENWQVNSLLESTRHNTMTEKIGMIEAITGRKVGNAQVAKMDKEARRIEYDLKKDVATGEIRVIKVSKDNQLKLGIFGGVGQTVTDEETFAVQVTEAGEVTYHRIEGWEVAE